MKYTINILGSGQEFIVGSVWEDIFNFFLESGIGFHDFINEHLDEETLKEIPKAITEEYNFDFSHRYEYDDIVHANGAYFDDFSSIQVIDESGNMVYESSVTDETNHSSEIEEDVYTTSEYTRFVVVGNEYARGQWDGYELTIEDGVFDPSKLKIIYNVCDESFSMIIGVEYDGVRLESNGDLGTSGQGSEWFLRDNETLFEIY